MLVGYMPSLPTMTGRASFRQRMTQNNDGLIRLRPAPEVVAKAA